MKYEILSKIYRMKSCLYTLLLVLVVASSCHRKSVPSGSRNNGEVTPLLNGSEVSEKPAASASQKPVVIVDSRGDFAVTQATLPADAPKEILDPSNARAYTPAQTKTLAFRFGKVPPRILYVPSGLVKKSARGSYYVLDKKFWYWKKSNGYFYIDENYFK